MANVYAIKTSQATIAQKRDALMIVQTMDSAIALLISVSVKLDSLGLIAQAKPVLITVEEKRGDIVMMENASVEMASLDLLATSEPALILVLITVNVSKESASVTVALKELIVLFVCALITVQTMECAQVLLSLNVHVMKVSSETIAL